MESQVYSVADIQCLLDVSRSKAYEFIKKVYREGEPFRVVKVGDNYRIPKVSFEAWLNASK